MRTITIIVGIVVALALLASAVAGPTPDKADKRAAKAECKLLRGKTAATREAFRTLYRGFAACVRATAAEEASEEQAAHKNAAKQCKAERDELGQQEFAEQYGTNANKRNAFGKCVSSKAKEHESEADEQDEQEAKEWKNAAKQCAAERDELGEEEFAEQYGTNAGKTNAFGKCVSGKARGTEGDNPSEA